MKTFQEVLQDFEHDEQSSWVEDPFAYMSDGLADRWGTPSATFVGRKVA